MLLRKMLRDLYKHKGTYLATMTLIMIGILVYTSFSMLHDSFSYSIDKYYDDYNFADGTIKVMGMPLSVVKDISRLSGISNVEGRLEKRIRLSSYEREVTFHFISYDAYDINRMNNIELMGGRMPDPKSKEVIMGNNYFKATNMELGDTIDVVVNGKEQELTVVGYGRSPEFIYAKKNDTELVADQETFDIVFMPYQAMGDLLGLSKQVNNISFKLRDGVELSDVKSDLREVVNSYGLLSMTDRDDQVSHSMTIQKLEGIGSMTASIPIMFLLISGSIINIVLKRIIEQERSQIGVLKAFGIPDGKILMHYISYALIISWIGGAIGMYLGLLSLEPFIVQMGVGFNMPFITKGLYQKYFLVSIILCTLFGMVSGYLGARSCLKLEAAEAMRPPVSKEGKSGIIDKLYFLVEGLDIKIKLALRNIFRNKGRSIFIIFGISITSAVLVFPIAMKEIYDAMLLDQFTKVEVYDTKITLSKYMDRERAINEVAFRDGVTRVEAQVNIPVTIYNKWRNKDTVIIGVQQDSELYRLYDTSDNRVRLPSEGILLSEYLAKSLGVQRGDYIRLKSPMFRDDDYQTVRVADTIPQYVGANAYIDIAYTSSLLGEDVINSLMITGTPDGLKGISKMYNDASMVSGFDYREIMAANLGEFMQQTTSVIGVLVFVGLIIGFSVIYVSITISMSERHKELATLLVVGLNEGEVHMVMILEQAILSVFGIILGLPLGKMMLYGMSESASTDLFVLPYIIPARAFVFSVLLTIVSMILPQIFARRKINRIKVTEALNARE